MKLSSLSILVPAYKDQETVGVVVLKAVRVAKQVSKTFEVVVINDASPDATGVVLEKLKKQIPHLRVIHHAHNQGYGGTMKELYVLGKNEWMFTVPGDNQIEPVEIKKLIPYTTQADMIIGWRRDRKDTPSRKRQSSVYNGLLRFLFGISFHDVNSIRLMRRSIMGKRRILSSSAFVDAELTIGAMRNGFRIIETPIDHRRRETLGAGGGKLSVIVPVIFDMLRYRLQTIL